MSVRTRTSNKGKEARSDDSPNALITPNGWRITYQLVTPEMAREWLTYNTHNRNLRPGVVGQWTEIMKTVGWDEDISPIAFHGYLDDDKSRPILLNGQHRLQSLAAAEASVWWIIVEGVQIQVQIEMDTGTRRKLDDQLRLRGITSPQDLGAVIRICYLWEKGQIRGKGAGPSYSALLKWYDANPNIVEVLPTARRLWTVIGGKQSVYGATRWILLNLPDAPPNIEEEVDAFFELIRSGDGATGDAPKAFREAILRLKAPTSSRRTMTTQQMMALLFKAWNHWQDGTTVQHLVWRGGGQNPEPFPMPYINR